MPVAKAGRETPEERSAGSLLKRHSPRKQVHPDPRTRDITRMLKGHVQGEPELWTQKRQPVGIKTASMTKQTSCLVLLLFLDEAMNDLLNNAVLRTPSLGLKTSIYKALVEITQNRTST